MKLNRVVVFASGGGSNFEVLARAGVSRGSPVGPSPEEPPPVPYQRERAWRVVGLITNKRDVGAVSRAESLRLPVRVIPTLGRPEAEVAQDTLAALSGFRADIVCLAGYLRPIPAEVVQALRGRIINVHPAPLPRFGGKGMYGRRVHEAVIEAGVDMTAATVHHVVEEYDRGAELLRRPVKVLPRDTPTSLARRVLAVEHFLYPLAIDRLCAALPAAAEHAHAKRALISVSDKSGVVDFARGLIDRGFEILSTGGTAGVLRSANVAVTEVTRLTGHPEMLDGRVKTLHPAVHAGILWRRGVESDRDAMDLLGYGSIDLVAVNLYPFEETAARGDVSADDVIEQIDVGGPSMLRAAAKAHAHVWVVPDPSHYDAVLEALGGSDALDSGGSPQAHPVDGAALRRSLAATAFRVLSGYDSAIADYLAGTPPIPSADPPEQLDLADHPALPGLLTPRLRRFHRLRYGENPDQAAALYAYGDGGEGIPAMHQLHGRELSYNNILDLDGALVSLSPFEKAGKAATVIVKHATPCGVAVADSLVEAYGAALATDRESAFGSVVAVNRDVDDHCAEEMGALFIECLVAPGFTDGALGVLTRKKNVRLLALPEIGNAGREGKAPSIRSVAGGVLAQTAAVPPTLDGGVEGWRVVSARHPTEREANDLRFAWCAVFGVKSNAVLLARGGAAIGIGGGQTSRVESSRAAVARARRAGFDLVGSVLASDGFFPFRDGIDEVAEVGVTAIIQPGGSRRDPEVVAAADERGMAMVLTGCRIFRH